MIKLDNFFVSLSFAGYIKIIPPGTFASFLSIVILFPIVEYKIISLEIFVIVFIVIFLLSLFFINKFSSRTQSHDSKIIVIDEFLGIYLILLFYDQIKIINPYVTMMLIFILFRFFDILKIFPANIIDKRLKSAFGVILDDLIAGLYTIIILYILNAYY
ncbi:phosphatidylglycerophosphatase A [Pelagibacteraceae bacterium]|nr:phosphatidylglycerophosphatase A [Pelagibacteraceae bacterium]